MQVVFNGIVHGRAWGLFGGLVGFRSALPDLRVNGGPRRALSAGSLGVPVRQTGGEGDHTFIPGHHEFQGHDASFSKTAVSDNARHG